MNTSSDKSDGVDDEKKAYGVWKPVGHVLMSFPGEDEANGAIEALQKAGFAPGTVVLHPAAEVASTTRRDIEDSGILASIGQELNLARAHLALAEAGHPFVTVKVDDDAAAVRAAEVGRRFQADRAQHYGRLIIEELIEPGTGEAQVAESPERGLDAQTPSGNEQTRES
jgi:hypothetical protein